MADISNLSQFLTDVATAIREKKGTEEQIPAANFDTEIKSIETGSISPEGITVTPDDVVFDKKFINMSGTLDSGRLTPSKMTYKDNDIEAKLQTLVRSFGNDTSTVFNDLGIYYDDGLHILHDLSLTTEVLEQYDFSIDSSNVLYVDAGCKDYFGTNTIVIALANDTTLWLYLYNITTHTLTLKTTETVANYSYPALNPYYNIINISDGKTSRTHTSKMYEISSTFELTQLYTVTASSSSTSKISTIFWYNKDFYKIITESQTTNRYVTGGSVITGIVRRMKSDRTGEISVSLSTDTGEEDGSYFAGASPDSSMIIRSGNNIASVFTIGYAGTSHKEIYTGLHCDIYNYQRVIFLTSTVFVGITDNFKKMKVYKINDNSIEVLATYNSNNRFSSLQHRYYPVVSDDDGVYDKLFTAASNSVVSSVTIQNQTFIDLSSGSSGSAEDDDVLKGKTYFSNSERREGTMPNNGELNYTPSTSSQIIPMGYTEGGTISPVTSNIDQYIQSKNIKKDVTILGVTGNLVFNSDDATALASEIFANKTAYIAGGKKRGTFSLNKDEIGYGVDEIKKEYIGIPNSFDTEIVNKSIMDSFNRNGDEQFYLIDSYPNMPHTFYYLNDDKYDCIGVLNENYELIQTIQASKDWNRTSPIGSPWISISCTIVNGQYYVGIFSDYSSTNFYSIYRYNSDTLQYELTDTNILPTKNKWKFHKCIPGLLCGGSKCYTLTSDGYLIEKSFSNYGTYNLTNREEELRYANDALCIVRSHIVNSTINGQIKYYNGTDFTNVTSYSNLLGLSQNHYGAIYNSNTQTKIVKFNIDYTSYDEILTIANVASPFRYIQFITDDIIGIYSLVGSTSYAYRCQTISIDIYKINYDTKTYEQIYSDTISLSAQSIANTLCVDSNSNYTMFWLDNGVNTRLAYLEIANKLISCIDGAFNRYYSYDNASTLTDLSNVLENTGTVIYKNGLGSGTMKNNGDVVISPSMEQQTKERGYYNSLVINAVTASIDNNIQAENIKKDVSILGVTGTMEAGLDTSDANATADDILMNKTAYINGEKITGTLPLFPNSRTFVVDNAGVTDNTEDSTLDLTTINVTKQVLDNNVNMKFSAPYSDITTAIGLTADKIKAGVTILGVTGTYTGETTE